MLKIENLHKIYGKYHALSGLDMTVKEGALYGFVGPNGAGKTTAIKIMTGLLQAEEGSVLINGKDALADPDQLKSCIGYVPDFFGVYDNLTVGEYMSFFASCYQLDGLVARKRYTALLEQVGLEDKLDFYVDGLSRGMKQRLCLARALIHDPQILILDEPTNHMDIQAKETLESAFQAYEGTILFVSHDRYFLDRIVRRIFAFEGNGKITQYEGGFTDYQAAVLRKEVEAEAMAAGNPKAGVKSDKSKDEKSEEDSKSSKKTWNGGPKKLRFTYQEQKDWDVIESQIEKLEEEIAGLEVQMEKAASDFVKLKELMDRKAQAESELDAKMERWMYLNDLAEKIEKQ